MTKIPFSFSVDEKSVALLDKLLNDGRIESKSRFISDLVKEGLDRYSDPMKRLRELDTKRAKIQQQIIEVITDIERISIEGALKEREEARKLLGEQKKKEEEELKKLKTAVDFIKQSELWSRLKDNLPNPTDNTSIREWVIEFQDRDMGVGFFNFKRILERGLLK